MPSWLAIAFITILISAGSSAVPASGRKWFRRLQRPTWLTFEKAIPIIWMIVFIGGAWSAYIVWEQRSADSNAWLWMMGYILLEAITVSYTVVMLRTQRLKVGLVIGATGFLIGLMLAISVTQLSWVASALLLPYVAWSPVGTYITWVMMALNPLDA